MAMKNSMFPWADMAMQSTMLAIEAQQVIAMRLTKMAMGGPDVQREAELMVSEKLETMAAGGQMMLMAALGGQPDMGAGKVMKLYRRKVSANRKRLSA
jgi:hypothetical protein